MTEQKMMSRVSIPRKITRRQAAELHAQYMYCIAPFVKKKSELLGFCQVKRFVNDDGSLGKSKFIIPDGMQKMLDLLDELIASARRDVFGDREIVIEEEDR